MFSKVPTKAVDCSLAIKPMSYHQKSIFPVLRDAFLAYACYLN